MAPEAWHLDERSVTSPRAACDREYVIHQSSPGEGYAKEGRMGELGMDPNKKQDSPDLPEDQRSDWAKDDREIEGRKPDLGEIEEDTSEL
jgi:hypothetical protein